jgi:hypothetical protein
MLQSQSQQCFPKNMPPRGNLGPLMEGLPTCPVEIPQSQDGGKAEGDLRRSQPNRET